MLPSCNYFDHVKLDLIFLLLSPQSFSVTWKKGTSDIFLSTKRFLTGEILTRALFSRYFFLQHLNILAILNQKEKNINLPFLMIRL